ncbi:MAG: PDZ domain-containing protein, partial [Spirochaetota bacterium]|nr:PDZ domain-containing protein [Spirochaetota bacterium]
MKKCISISKALSVGMVLLTILFSNLVLSSTQIFAQSASDSERETALRSRQYIELIGSIFSYVENNYVDKLNPELLYEGALKGMLEAINDPYTSYLDKSNMRDLNDTTVGNFGGVGLTISKPVTSTPEKPAYVEVSSPIDGGPGFKAGIQAGDFLVAINGIETKDITMEEVLSMLRGTIGETV